MNALVYVCIWIDSHPSLKDHTLLNLGENQISEEYQIEVIEIQSYLYGKCYTVVSNIKVPIGKNKNMP